MFEFKYQKFQSNAKKINLLKHSIDYPYTIQIDSFEQIDRAKLVVADLKHLGYNAYIGKVFQNNQDVYRVYVEEFDTLKNIQKVLKSLKKIPSYKKSFIRRKY